MNHLRRPEPTRVEPMTEAELLGIPETIPVGQGVAGPNRVTTYRFAGVGRKVNPTPLQRAK